MKYDTHQWFDAEIDNIMKYLFVYRCPQVKQQQYESVVETFTHLDLATTYVLFDLIQERLPRRAKLLFAGEDFQGKKETVLEVMHKILMQK